MEIKTSLISSLFEIVQRTSGSQKILDFNLKYNIRMVILSKKKNQFFTIEGKNYSLPLSHFTRTERYILDAMEVIDLAILNVEQETTVISSQPQHKRRRRLLASMIQLDPLKKLIEINPIREYNMRRLRKHKWESLEITIRDVVSGLERQFWTGGVAISVGFFQNYLDW